MKTTQVYSVKPVHLIEQGRDKARRLRSTGRFGAGARCGNGAYPANYPAQFTNHKESVTCTQCLKLIGVKKI